MSLQQIITFFNRYKKYTVGGIAIGISIFVIIILIVLSMQRSQDSAPPSLINAKKKIKNVSVFTQGGERISELSLTLPEPVEQAIVSITPLEDALETGTATFSSVGAKKTKIVFNIGNASRNQQPVAIYYGSCNKREALYAELAPLIQGASETLLDRPFTTLVSQLPLTLVIYRSPADSAPPAPVACGDILIAQSASSGAGVSLSTSSAQ